MDNILFRSFRDIPIDWYAANSFLRIRIEVDMLWKILVNDNNVINIINPYPNINNKNFCERKYSFFCQRDWLLKAYVFLFEMSTSSKVASTSYINGALCFSPTSCAILSIFPFILSSSCICVESPSMPKIQSRNVCFSSAFSLWISNFK